MCRPKFVEKDSSTYSSPVLDVKKMWHPFVPENHQSQWMPNDVRLGGESEVPSVMILTGPNMVPNSYRFTSFLIRQ